MQIMEMIWDDLCQMTEGLASPEWHASVLGERENNLKSGKERYLEWDEVKKQIKKEIE